MDAEADSTLPAFTNIVPKASAPLLAAGSTEPCLHIALLAKHLYTAAADHLHSPWQGSEVKTGLQPFVLAARLPSQGSDPGPRSLPKTAAGLDPGFQRQGRQLVRKHRVHAPPGRGSRLSPAAGHSARH